MSDSSFLQAALDNALQSFKDGNFPAGAVVARAGVVLASAISSSHPSLLHADSKAVTAAFERHGPLTGATLYIAMEPCLMCTGIAYWAGIRRIVYALPKNRLSGDYYETPSETRTLISGFNESVELICLPELTEKALDIVRLWEKQNSL